MPLPKILYTVFLYVVGIVALFSAVAVTGWWSTPFIIAVWGVAYLIENSVRQGRMDDWKIYLGLPGFFLVSIALCIPSLLKRNDKGYAPIYRFDELKASQGILKKGASGDISLIRDDRPSLSLLCRDNAGKGSMQTCITDDFKQAYGRRVTVYHEPEFRRMITRVYIYEVRFNGRLLVSYDKIVENVHCRRVRKSKADSDFMIILFTSTICSLVYVALRRTSQRSVQ